MTIKDYTIYSKNRQTQLVAKKCKCHIEYNKACCLVSSLCRTYRAIDKRRQFIGRQ